MVQAYQYEGQQGYYSTKTVDPKTGQILLSNPFTSNESFNVEMINPGSTGTTAPAPAPAPTSTAPVPYTPKPGEPAIGSTKVVGTDIYTYTASPEAPPGGVQAAPKWVKTGTQTPQEEAAYLKTQQTPISQIQNVFGSTWQPAPAFTPEIQAKGIYGAVRITGHPEVYTLGPGGGWESQDTFKSLFGTSDQTGIVGEISVAQAAQLGIKVNPDGTPVAGAVARTTLPGAPSFNDTFGEDTSKIVEDSSSIDNNEAAAEAKRKEEEAKKLANLQTDTEKLTFTQQQALLKRDLEAMGVDWQTGEKITKPPLPNYESTGKSLMSEYGIEKIQNDLNSLDSQIADLEASIRMGVYNQEGGVKPMELVGTAQRELARQGQEALDTLTRAKAVLVDQYNTKIGLINTLMGWKKMDYEAASGQYNQDFSNALTLMQIVQGRMDDAEKEENAVKDAASANLSLLTQMMQDSGKVWDDLDVSMMAQIYKLEVQAGLPQGITQAIYNSKDATKEESFHIVSEDQSQVTIFYKDGTSSTYDTGLTAGGGSGGFTAWQQYQMQQDVEEEEKEATEKEEKAQEDRDKAFEDYLYELQDKILAEDSTLTRENAIKLLKARFSDYDAAGAIYDLIPDTMDPGTIEEWKASGTKKSLEQWLADKKRK